MRGRRMVVVVSALLLTSCSGQGAASPRDSGPASNAGTPGTSGDPAVSERPVSGADIDGARELIEGHERVPAFEPPGEPIDVTQLENKLIYNVPSISEVAFCQTVDRAMEETAAKVGLQYSSWRNSGEQAQHVQGINNAISQEADVLLLTCGADPGQLQPQVQAAADADIPVVAGHTYDPAQESAANVAARQDAQFELAGRLMAAWAIVQTEGTANVLVLEDREYSSTFPLVDGINAEFESRCPDCVVKTVNIDVNDWSSRIPTTVQSEIVGNSELDYILPIYDGMVQFVVPAITAAGAGETVKVASYNGSPYVLDMIRDDDIVTMDVGESMEWAGRATMDQAFRLLLGVEPSDSAILPLRVWHDGNVEEAGTPADFLSGWGDEFKSGYDSLWGIAD